MHPPKLLRSTGTGLGIGPCGCDESQRRGECSQETDRVAHDVLPLWGTDPPTRMCGRYSSAIRVQASAAETGPPGIARDFSPRAPRVPLVSEARNTEIEQQREVTRKYVERRRAGEGPTPVLAFILDGRSITRCATVPARGWAALEPDLTGPRGRDASSRCPHAPRCGSATHSAPGGRISLGSS